MDKINHIKLYHLVAVYIVLIAVYIVIPHAHQTARQALSVSALVMLGLIFLKSIQFLRQS